jgi:hypothetical protein
VKERVAEHTLGADDERVEPHHRDSAVAEQRQDDVDDESGEEPGDGAEDDPPSTVRLTW